MELYQLTYFRMLNRCGSFRQAAQELYISPSALSSAVKKLEAEIGLPLLDRSAQHLSLTPAGQEVLDCAVSVARDLDILQEHLDRLADQKISLRIAVEHMAFSGAFLEALDAFSRKYPNVNVVLSRREGDSIRQLVSERSLDCGIVIHSEAELRHGITAESYCRAEYGLYTRRMHEGGVVETRELTGQTLTLLNDTGDMASPLQDYFSRFGVQLEAGAITDMYPDTAWPLIREGLGEAVFPLDLHAMEEGLYVYPFDPPLLLPYDYIYAVHSPIGRVLRLLREFLGKEPV